MKDYKKRKKRLLQKEEQFIRCCQLIGVAIGGLLTCAWLALAKHYVFFLGIPEDVVVIVLAVITVVMIFTTSAVLAIYLAGKAKKKKIKEEKEALADDICKEYYQELYQEDREAAEK